LASVLKDPIDFNSLPKTTPPAIRVLLDRCLDRDRNTRLRDIGEARIAIDRKPFPVAEETRKPITRTIWPWAAAAILAVAAIIGWLRPARVNPESVILTIPAPSGEDLIDVPVISPDGLSVWYQTRSFRMYVRRIDSLESRLLPGSSPRPLFWSADSNAFFHWESGLRRTQLKSGLQDLVLSDPRVSIGAGAWSDSGTLLLTGRDVKEPVLAAMPSSGGEPKSHSLPKQLRDISVSSFEYLPGGDDFIISGVANSGDSAVYLATLRDGKPADAVLLLKNPTDVHYTPAGGGRLLYVHNDNLYSRKLNRRARRLEGDPELELGGVASEPPSHSFFSVARNGTIAWRPGKARSSQVEEFDRSGRLISTSGPPGIYSAIVPAPDGRRLLAYAFDQLGGMAARR
jgi:hypothetical protein